MLPFIPRILAKVTPMDIRIDIGNAEQRALIRKELGILEDAAAAWGIQDRIERIAVPADFEDEVRRLSGDPDFEQNRGYALVMAKIIEKREGATILISPGAFTAGLDTQIRVGYYVHELAHVYHKSRFPQRADESGAEKIYADNLYCLFDDYAAERTALETCTRVYGKLSNRYADWHRAICAAHIEVLDSDQTYHDLLRAVVRFRLGGMDIAAFQLAVQPAFDSISKSLVYAAVYIDSGTGFHEDSQPLADARFVTPSAQELVSFFAAKYRDDDFDLSDGTGLITAFVRTLGFSYEDTSEGLYCRVVGLSI